MNELSRCCKKSESFNYAHIEERVFDGNSDSLLNFTNLKTAWPLTGLTTKPNIFFVGISGGIILLLKILHSKIHVITCSMFH